MRLIKVLLVDDESIVISDLLSLIDWEKNQCKVMGYAYNALQALNLAQKYLPDLVFMDVSLPGMDGLDLSAKIQELAPSVTIIILSGYMDFSYAQRAIDIGIFTYLVKHELSPAKLESTLQKVHQKIDYKNREEALIRRELLSKMLIEQRPFHALSSQKQAHFSPYEGLLIPVVITPIRPFWGMLDDIWSTTSEELSAFAEHMPSQPLAILDVIHHQENVILFLFDSDKITSKSELSAKLRETVLSYLQSLKHRYQLEFFAVLFPRRACTEHLLSEVLLLQELVLQYPFHPNTSLLCLETVPTLSGETDFRFINKQQFTENFIPLEQKVHCMLTVALSNKDSLLFSSCMNHLLRLFQDFSFDLPQESHALYSAKDIADFLQVQMKVLHQSLCQKQEYSAVTNYVIQYIESSYNQQPTLHEVSQRLHSSSMYIGQKFKRDTGVTFHDYLSQCRIRHAKRLLANTSIKMFEITQSIGFSNSQYFSKLFKEATGKTPNEYRQEITRQ